MEQIPFHASAKDADKFRCFPNQARLLGEVFDGYGGIATIYYRAFELRSEPVNNARIVPEIVGMPIAHQRVADAIARWFLTLLFSYK